MKNLFFSDSEHGHYYLLKYLKLIVNPFIFEIILIDRQSILDWVVSDTDVNMIFTRHQDIRPTKAKKMINNQKWYY